MSADITPTVRVKASVSKDNPHGYIVINKADYDPKEHKLHEETKAAQKATKAKAARVPHTKETKAEKQARLADEKQAKKDAAAAGDADLDAGESTR